MNCKASSYIEMALSGNEMSIVKSRALFCIWVSRNCAQLIVRDHLVRSERGKRREIERAVSGKDLPILEKVFLQGVHGDLEVVDVDAIHSELGSEIEDHLCYIVVREQCRGKTK